MKLLEGENPPRRENSSTGYSFFLSPLSLIPQCSCRLWAVLVGACVCVTELPLAGHMPSAEFHALLPPLQSIVSSYSIALDLLISTENQDVNSQDAPNQNWPLD